tara:strand:- start:55 stop:891 length:837 start_codon:yes stop_codon:yes gene_type:complete
MTAGGEPGRGGMVYRPSGGNTNGRNGTTVYGHSGLALQFDCSSITSKPASASLRLHAAGNGLLTNIASDHKFVLAKAGAGFIFSSAAAGGMFTVDTSVLSAYDGHTTNSTAYSLTEYATFNPADIDAGGDVLLINLNNQALNDLASQDAFVFFILDKSYQADNNDPFTSAPSAGALTDVRIKITAGGLGDNVPRLIVDADNRVRDQKPDKDRIEKDFTLNTFADITQQRTRFSKGGVVVDQVPFLLGMKGPLSLRGRQFDDDGKPISTTVNPPNTSKS